MSDAMDTWTRRGRGSAPPTPLSQTRTITLPLSRSPARADTWFRERADAFLAVQHTPAPDAQETSDPGAGLRPLSPVVAVVDARPDDSLADRPEQPSRGRRRRRPHLARSGTVRDAVAHHVREANGRVRASVRLRVNREVGEPDVIWVLGRGRLCARALALATSVHWAVAACVAGARRCSRRACACRETVAGGGILATCGSGDQTATRCWTNQSRAAPLARSKSAT
jgi:hypothetical protein